MNYILINLYEIYCNTKGHMGYKKKIYSTINKNFPNDFNFLLCISVSIYSSTRKPFSAGDNAISPERETTAWQLPSVELSSILFNQHNWLATRKPRGAN